MKSGWGVSGAGRWASLSLVVASSLACQPRSVAEAEAKGNLKWLEANGSSEAIAALGRMADENEQALAIVKARASVDVNVYKTAWDATVRDAAWGAPLLREALQDPTRAELAAASMDRRDPHVGIFLKELEGALLRLSATPNNGAIASGLASIGPTAHEAVEARLKDASTRGGMCRGVASSDSSEDARKTFMTLPSSARDHAMCVEAAVVLATRDDAVLAWVATRGEPALVGAAAKSDAMTCERLQALWARALAERPAESYASLVVPLGSSIRRCPTELDTILATALTRLPATHGIVTSAIDPSEAYGNSLKVTCKAIATLDNPREQLNVRERARAVASHTCQAP